MTDSRDRWRVAIVGASSLLGKEIATVLEERKFPLERLFRLATQLEEPELPILDIDAAETEIFDDASAATDLDLVFLATPSGTDPGFLSATAKHAPVAIDLAPVPAASKNAPLRIPPLEARSPREREAPRVVSPHPATIVLSTLLLRLADAGVTRAVAEIFLPASEFGARAIEELQRQTLNLLSFQKIPSEVFGAQLAFNLLPRLGENTRLAETANFIQSQLDRYLAGRAPVPALRVLQTASFHSMAASLYLETETPVTREKLFSLLSGGGVKKQREADAPASQVEAAGSDEILLDLISTDATRPEGFWLWAAVDNIRLAAVNAVEIAEVLLRPRHQDTKTGTK
jgi:aspartate-semialdehyde dehydrogenase